jgi:predicted GIY-YIG superfamily endonuclease
VVWIVYIVCCRDGTYYTGITTDLRQRVARHNAGKGGRYTRTRQPVRVVYTESQPTRSGALRREREIKSWARRRKEALILATSYSQRVLTSRRGEKTRRER